ncbi:ABC transporter substrate-binding protein [Sodalis sp. dw_96]|uniref:ABC transporter substrate-binding protein n=1 Tax=Sodalis sp. dw_96 TaxID=2719794 RepID=UPI001BD37585|nr:ABC transporter substrate-binding protein [Sodalis sp. dw_96]
MQRNILLCLIGLVLAAPLWAKDIHTIRWGVDSGFPPFDELAPNGEIVGFDIDIANALCEQLGAECVFVKQPFESMIAALNVNKFDAIIGSMNITEERKKEVDFTEKYYSSGEQLVARKGSGLRPDPAVLKGKTIGVQLGSVDESYARKHWAGQGVKLVAYHNQDSVYLDLFSGRIDAALQNNLQAATGFLNTEKGKNFGFAGPAIQDGALSSDVGIAVAKSNPELLEALNHAIRAIRANGTYDRIQQRYFSFDIYGS